MRRCAWGSNAPHRKYISPLGSAHTKLNVLWVTRAVYFYSLRVRTEHVYLMRPAPTVYFYFLRVTPTILLLRAGGTHRTELSSYSRHAAASTPLVGCAANLLSAIYAFITTCNSWYLLGLYGDPAPQKRSKNGRVTPL